MVREVSLDYHIPRRISPSGPSRGLGEQLDDMQPFDAREFVNAIFGD